MVQVTNNRAPASKTMCFKHNDSGRRRGWRGIEFAGTVLAVRCSPKALPSYSVYAGRTEGTVPACESAKGFSGGIPGPEDAMGSPVFLSTPAQQEVKLWFGK
jgi:hypothetical protein